jgi:RHS repeat-associated protein
MRNLYTRFLKRPLTAASFCIGMLMIFSSSATAQCYEDFYVSQTYPYGTLCSPGNVTLQAQYFPPYNSFTNGEFRWYTSDTDPNPVYTSYVDDFQTTSSYTFYAATSGATMWVSYFNYLTWCESYRMPYSVYISSYPSLTQDYARECGDGTARIQMNSNTSGVTYQLYYLYEYWDPYYGYVSDYQYVSSNYTGYFEIPYFDPNDQYKYYVKIYNPYGCNTNYYTPVYIDIGNVSPPSVSGNTVICQGGSTTLTASGGNANDYGWYQANSSTLLQSGSQYTLGSTLPVGTHNFWVRSLSYSSCISEPTLVTITVNPKPVDGSISASATTICLGQSVTISSTGGVGTPHYWCSSNGGASWNVFVNSYIGQSSFQHTPTATGTYRYHLRNETPCGYCWDQPGGCPTFPYVDVTVVASPAVSINVSSPQFGQGETILTASLTTGNYQWQLNGVDIAGATSRTYKPQCSGNYIVKVTSGSGCVSTSAAVSVTIGDYNYIITNIINTPSITNTDQVSTLNANQMQQSISYLDGLGREMQRVETQGSPTQKDIVGVTILDNLNRASKAYLPYTGGTDGSYKTNAVSAQASFYQTLRGDNLAFAETKFENAPTNRIVEQGGPGASWQIPAAPAVGHTKKFAYRKNTSNEVRLWNYDASTKTATGTTYYTANVLFAAEMTDEQGLKRIEYKNKSGMIVSSKVQKIQGDENSYQITYYIYDDFGNLRFTVPAEAVNNLAAVGYTFTYNDAFCKRWLYANEFDDIMRQTEKSVPGAGITYYIYDPRNKVVLTQDAVQRPANKWLFGKYDVLGRTIVTGIYTHGSALTQAQMQAWVDAFYANNPAANPYEGRSNVSYSVQHGYTNQAFPVSGQPLKVSYYDDYDFDYNGVAAETSKGEPSFVNMGGGFATASASARGQLTGERKLVLGTSTWLTTATYYNIEGQVAQTQLENYNTSAIAFSAGRSMEVRSFQYDFSGKVMLCELWHCNIIGSGAYNFKVKQRLVYDHTGRPLETYVQVGSTTEKKVATQTYEETGLVKSKALGATPLETLTYEYNIRGWLTTVNKNYMQAATTPTSTLNWFGMELSYDNNTSVVNNTSYTNPMYNSSISGTTWKTRGAGENRKYDYSYDNLNRLIAADFKQQFGSTWANTDPSNSNFTIDFSIGGKGNSNQHIQYDDNGNIISLWQKGLKINTSPKIDDLDYGYAANGNKLTTVYDAMPDPAHKLGDFQDGASLGVEYIYDDNGNLVDDKNKNQTITYNHLNLPELITINGKGTIQYVYDAQGNKLTKTVTDTRVTPALVTTYAYIGGLMYRQNVLQQMQHTEGRVRWLTPATSGNTGSFVFDYFIKDHVGNIRMILTEEQQTIGYAPASMEDVVDKNNLNDPANYIPYYYNTDYTVAPSVRTAINTVQDYPTDTYTPVNNYVAKTNGLTAKVGPAMLLKVMAGDRFNLRVTSWYKLNGANPVPVQNPLTDLVTILANGISAANGGKITSSALQSSGALGPNVSGFLNGRTYDNTKPKAYVNWILLDDQFNYVSSSSSFEQVGGSQQFSTHIRNNLPIDKSGYLYVYVSNESENVNVYFDNLQVTHIRGPLLEESHYYPMGLEMAGISSHVVKAAYTLNKLKYQGQEFESALDFNMYEFESRQYDPQLGRWWAPDPANQFASPYTAMANNWPTHVDPNGQIAFVPALLIAAAIGGAVNVGIQAINGNIDNFGDGLRAFGIGAAQGALAFITGGSSYATMTAWQFAGQFALNQGLAVVASQLPSLNISIGNFNLSVSPSFFMGSEGFGFGASVGASMQIGDFALGASVGVSQYAKTPGAGGKSYMTKVGGGVAYFDRGSGSTFSLSLTKFSGAKDKQTLWQAGYQRGDFSIKLNEDYLISGDKYRTFGLEVTTGDISFGTTIYTPPGTGADRQKDYRSKIWGKNKKEAYTNEATRIYSNFYIGYRTGNNVMRFGVDSPWIQDFFQNGFHRIGSNTPFFPTDYRTPMRLFYQYSSYDPYTLY